MQEIDLVKPLFGRILSHPLTQGESRTLIDFLIRNSSLSTNWVKYFVELFQSEGEKSECFADELSSCIEFVESILDYKREDYFLIIGKIREYFLVLVQDQDDLKHRLLSKLGIQANEMRRYLSANLNESATEKFDLFSRSIENKLDRKSVV